MTTFKTEIYTDREVIERQWSFTSSLQAWAYVQRWATSRWPGEPTFNDEIIGYCMTHRYEEIQLQSGYFARVSPTQPLVG